MTVSNEAVLSGLVRGLRDALTDDALIDSFSHEARPDEIPLVYRPPKKQKTASPEPEKKKHSFGHLPGNFTCSLCPERTYPSRKFQRSGRLPVLIVIYNGSITPAKMRPDRSGTCIFASPEEDEFYAGLLGEKGFTLDDFHFQQLPGCHFNPDRSLGADWKRRTEACLTHIEQAVTARGIKHILISPPALAFLFGKDRAAALVESREVFSLKAGAVDVPSQAFRRVDPKGQGRAEFLSILESLKSRF